MDKLLFLRKTTEYIPGLSWVCGVLGAIGGALSWLFGGWDMAIAVLIGAMGIDFATGYIVAAVFGKSKKSENGGLESRAGWKGLCRKGMTLLVVLIAALLDRLLGSTFLRDAVIVAYLVNELLSIAENAALMGVPFPAPLKKAIDILKKKSDEDGGESDADT